MTPPPVTLDTPDASAPVTRARIARQLQQRGHTFSDGSAENCFDLKIADSPLSVCVHEGRGILSVRGQWETDLPYDQVEYPLFAATDSWNRKNPFPTLYTVEDSDGAAVVVADFSALISAGMHDAHLDEALSVGLEQGKQALKYLRGVAERILGFSQRDQ